MATTPAVVGTTTTMTTTTTSVGVAFLTEQQKQEWWGGINRASRPCPRESDNPCNLFLPGRSFFQSNNQHMSHHRVVSATPSGLTSHESDNPHDLLLPGLTASFQRNDTQRSTRVPSSGFECYNCEPHGLVVAIILATSCCRGEMFLSDATIHTCPIIWL